MGNLIPLIKSFLSQLGDRGKLVYAGASEQYRKLRQNP